jgi:hypothetical protein
MPTPSRREDRSPHSEIVHSTKRAAPRSIVFLMPCLRYSCEQREHVVEKPCITHADMVQDVFSALLEGYNTRHVLRESFPKWALCQIGQAQIESQARGAKGKTAGIAALVRGRVDLWRRVWWIRGSNLPFARRVRLSPTTHSTKIPFIAVVSAVTPFVHPARHPRSCLRLFFIRLALRHGAGVSSRHGLSPSSGVYQTPTTTHTSNPPPCLA